LSTKQGDLKKRLSKVVKSSSVVRRAAWDLAWISKQFASKGNEKGAANLFASRIKTLGASRFASG
jgi:hypothetical protein